MQGLVAAALVADWVGLQAVQVVARLWRLASKSPPSRDQW